MHERGELEYPERDDIELVDVLQALGDPSGCRSCASSTRPTARSCVHEMGLPVSKSTGSHHLKVLREAGVVQAQVDGTRRYYTLRRDDLEARFPGLARQRPAPRRTTARLRRATGASGMAIPPIGVFLPTLATTTATAHLRLGLGVLIVPL